jgi:sRNA-binding carbon storage regulator CsrA
MDSIRRRTNLILTRKQGESIELYAGGELLGVISVNEIHMNFVRCSYEMDERVHVCRAELPPEMKIKTGVQRRKKAAAGVGTAARAVKTILIFAALLCSGGCIAPREMTVDARVAGQVVKIDVRR